MRLEGHGIAPAVAPRRQRRRFAVAERVDAVVAPQRADRDREIGQAGRQQAGVDVQRQGGGDFAAEGVARDHGGLAGAVQAGHLVDHEGAGRHLAGELAHAIDVQVDAAGHHRRAGDRRHRISHQIGPQLEVAAPLDAAQAHAAGPAQCRGHGVAHLPGREIVLRRAHPGSVVAGIAAAWTPDHAGPGAVQGAMAVEVAQVERAGQRTRATLAEQVVIEQHAGADLGRSGAAHRARAQHALFAQGVGQGQRQGLARRVVGPAHAADFIERKIAAAGHAEAGRVQAQLAQRIDRHAQGGPELDH